MFGLGLKHLMFLPVWESHAGLLHLVDTVWSALIAFTDIYGSMSNLCLPCWSRKGACTSFAEVTSLNAAHLETSTVSDSRVQVQHRALLSHLVEMETLICSRHWNWSVNTNTRYARGCQKGGIGSPFPLMESFFWSCKMDHSLRCQLLPATCTCYQREPGSGTFCPLKQNNIAFARMKGRGVGLPLRVHNKVPVETCGLVCHRIKSVSHVLEEMFTMLSVGQDTLDAVMLFMWSFT